jgi:hypothetical protein
MLDSFKQGIPKEQYKSPVPNEPDDGAYDEVVLKFYIDNYIIILQTT